jgi:hypothetical protein
MTDNKEEQLKSFWFYINDDYRSGKSIYAYTKSSKYEDPDEESDEDPDEDPDEEPDEDPDEEPDEEPDNIPEGALEIKFGLPTKGNRLYIVIIGYPNFKPIWHTDIDSDNEDYNDNIAKSLYLKIFSQIHHHLPFQVTGYNGAYKEKGHYPDVPDNIKSMPNIIDQELVKKISERQDYSDYFLFVVDKYGNEVRTHLLNPI